jgi:hypothetical protein
MVAIVVDDMAAAADIEAGGTKQSQNDVPSIDDGSAQIYKVRVCMSIQAGAGAGIGWNLIKTADLGARARHKSQPRRVFLLLLTFKHPSPFPTK